MCSNGAYGDRMVEVCRHARVPHAVYSEPYSDIPHVERIREMLDADPAITHVCMVHSETTTGLLNDIAPVGELCHERRLTFIVDAMSSFACVEMPVEDWHIDFLVSSANKGIQGVPGFSFIICRRDKLEASAGKARSLSMDLYDQWVPMERDGKWRYTSPTHVVLAFAKALRELEEEGGIPARAMHRHWNADCTLIGISQHPGDLSPGRFISQPIGLAIETLQAGTVIFIHFKLAILSRLRQAKSSSSPAFLRQMFTNLAKPPLKNCPTRHWKR